MIVWSLRESRWCSKWYWWRMETERELAWGLLS